MKKKRRKSSLAGLIGALVAIVLLFAICAGGGLAVANMELNKMQRGNNAYTAAGGSGNSRVKNILLIGQDRRPGEDRARSDSMILCSFNKSTKQITMVSLMRDMYVAIPGYDSNKLNAAYSYGGMQLLDQTIENNFGLHIDGNIEVDFEAFMQVIDRIGGVEIELNADEAAYLNENNTGLVNGVTTEPWSLFAGVNTLNSQQALAYARTRYVGNSDWERTDRQRRVLNAVIQKFKNSGIRTQIGFVDDVLPALTTDMGNSEMISLAMSVLLSGMRLNSESYRVPAEGTYYPDTISDMSVLVPDLEANKAYLQQIIGA